MKAESSAGCEKLAITPSTAQEPNKSDSSRSQDGSSDGKPPKVTENTKKSVPETSTKHQKHDQSSKNSKSVKNKEENLTGDKSERSSSPAFDSDEDSLGFSNQPQEQIALCANKKRAPSIGILLNTAHSSFFASKLNNNNNNSRVNETLPTQQTVVATVDSQKNEEMNKQKQQSKNQYHKSSIENELKCISMPVTPESNDETTTFVVHRKEERTKSLTKNFTPSPSSSLVVDKNSRPQSIISEGEPSSKDLLDDFVTRMDGADLKFMEEGSGMLSPTIDNSAANISMYRHHHNHHHNVNNNQNNNIVTNPSLLHKALIKATAQTKQPSPTVLMKSLENLQSSISPTEQPLTGDRISPTTTTAATQASMKNGSKNVTVSILKTPTTNPQQSTSSSAAQQINKLTLEVSVANENDNKLVTTIKNDTSFTGDGGESTLINVDDVKNKNSTNKPNKNLHNSSHDDEGEDNENILSLVDQNVGNRSAESHNTNNNHNNNNNKNKNTSSSEKKSFVQRIRKTLRLNGKKKTGQFLGFAGNRQKSKSENRARKAFRTISFILGAFVCSFFKSNQILSIDF